MIKNKIIINPVNALCLYTLLLIVLPKGVGFTGIMNINFNLWMILSLLLLIPFIIPLCLNGKIKIGIIELFLFGMVFCEFLRNQNYTDLKGSIVETGRLIISIFPPYLAGKYFIKNTKDLFKWAIALNVGSIIVFIMAFTETMKGRPFFDAFGRIMLEPENIWANSQILYERFGSIRTAASFSQPIFLGIFTFLIVGINIFLFQNKIIFPQINKPIFKAIITIQVLTSILSFYFSQSRTAVISFIIAITIVLIFKSSRMKESKALFVIILAIISIFFVYIQFNKEFEQLFIENFLSADASRNWNQRVEYMEKSFYYIINIPNWFGEGEIRSNELSSFIYQNDNLNGFINKILINGRIYFAFYLFIWIIAIKSSFKNSTIFRNMFMFSFIYLFIANTITIVMLQNEIIFILLLGIISNRESHEMVRQRLMKKWLFVQTSG